MQTTSAPAAELTSQWSDCESCGETRSVMPYAERPEMRLDGALVTPALYSSQCAACLTVHTLVRSAR